MGLPACPPESAWARSEGLRPETCHLNRKPIQLSLHLTASVSVCAGECECIPLHEHVYIYICLYMCVLCIYAYLDMSSRPAPDPTCKAPLPLSLDLPATETSHCQQYSSGFLILDKHRTIKLSHNVRAPDYTYFRISSKAQVCSHRLQTLAKMFRLGLCRGLHDRLISGILNFENDLRLRVQQD